MLDMIMIWFSSPVYGNATKLAISYWGLALHRHLQICDIIVTHVISGCKTLACDIKFLLVALQKATKDAIDAPRISRATLKILIACSQAK